MAPIISNNNSIFLPKQFICGPEFEEETQYGA